MITFLISFKKIQESCRQMVNCEMRPYRVCLTLLKFRATRTYSPHSFSIEIGVPELPSRLLKLPNIYRIRPCPKILINPFANNKLIYSKIGQFSVNLLSVTPVISSTCLRICTYFYLPKNLALKYSEELFEKPSFFTLCFNSSYP